MGYPMAYTLKECVDALVKRSHGAAAKAGWWDKEKTWETVPRCLMLIVSEIAEAMEGDRKDLMDDKLPHRKMIEVELADAMIRIADLAGALDLDLGGASPAGNPRVFTTRSDIPK